MVATVLHQKVRQVIADVQERTCTRCAEYTLFYPSDPHGNWYRCSQCSAYA